MSETHEVVCDECGDTYDLACGMRSYPQPPRSWTREGASDYCQECSQERAAADVAPGAGEMEE